jgi:hypothetical protein
LSVNRVNLQNNWVVCYPIIDSSKNIMWENLKYYRSALGINMVFNAYPIVFSIRDGLGIGPQGSTFTLAFWVIGILLVLPLNIFQKIYFPNPILFWSWFFFAATAFIYMFYYPSINFDYYSNRSRELLTYFLPLLFLFAMMFYPNDQVDRILPITIIFGMIGSIGLLYGIAHDPNWHFGERAAIKFAASGGQTSNPHAFANNALCCLLASLVYASIVRGFFWKIVCYLCAVFSLAIMILCRTNISLIGLGVMFMVFLLFNARGIVTSVFKPQVLMIMGTMFLILNLIAMQFSQYTNALKGYYEVFAKRLTNVIFTATGGAVSTNEAADIDHSSINRVYSFEYAINLFKEGEWATILVGEGYKAQFLDVPIVEALVNNGIVGFILIVVFFGAMGFTSLIEFIRPSSGFSTYLAYFSIVLLIASVSGARPIDISFWFVYVVYIRFLGIRYPKQALS